MVARHNRILAEFGITREQAPSIEVLSNFDIIIRLQQNPAGAAPVPVLPGGQEDRDGGTE